MLKSIVFVNAQTDIVGTRLKQEDLINVRAEYLKQQKQFKSAKTSFDVKSILVDLIPKIVLKNRYIRYTWDKRENPNIFVYRHLISFDSVDVNNVNDALRFTNRHTISSIDTSLTLSTHQLYEYQHFQDSYTRLPCLENFQYNFIFVDNILKADFLLSTISQDKDKVSKQIFVWQLPHFSQNFTYLLNIKMPWNHDCYQVNIEKEFMYSY